MATNERQFNHWPSEQMVLRHGATSQKQSDMDPLKRTILVTLNSVSLFARWSCFLLILSTLFARSAWTCSSANPSSCQSLWTIPSQTVGEVFAVASCVTALITLLLPLAPLNWGLTDWKWESVWTFITLIFSLVAWPLLANTLRDGYYLSWAFSVSVAGSIAACLAFGLSFREKPPVHETQWLSPNDKRIQVLCSTAAFACAFGSTPTLLNVVSQSQQSQAGSYTAITFFALQSFACAFCLNYALPSSVALSRLGYIVTQAFAIVFACVSLGLLTNLNVLPMVITANDFYVQGFLIGGASFGVLALCFCIIDQTGQTRVSLGTRMFLSPFPSVIVFFSTMILGTSFASLYVFVEVPAPQPANASSALLAASKSFLVLGALVSILQQFVSIWFLIRPADSRGFVLMTVKRTLLWLIALVFIFVCVGFATLTAFEKSVRYSAAMALTCLILSLFQFIAFLGTENTAYLVRRNYTSPLEASKQWFNTTIAPPEPEELRRARTELADERDALENVRRKLAKARSPHMTNGTEIGRGMPAGNEAGTRPSTFDLGS